MFFLPAILRPGEAVGGVMARWGLDRTAQTRALALRENGRLRAALRARVISPDHSLPVRVHGPPQTVYVMVPINIELRVTQYDPLVDLVRGLAPRDVTEVGPPVYTHGMEVRIERNLGLAIGLRWIQTTTRLNDHMHAGRLTEFTDGAINDEPWVFPAGPQEVFTDKPVAPVPRPGAAAIDFEATATLSVLFRDRIILGSGITWGFQVNRGTPGIVPKPSRAATHADYTRQLRILRGGKNVFGEPAGAGLAYELPPADGGVVPLRPPGGP